MTTNKVRAGMRTSVENLLTAVAHGDRNAFEALYDQFASRLLGLVVTILGSRQDADDVLQEVFREVWTRADRYDPRLGSQEGWLIMLTRARSIDHLRRKGAELARKRAHEAARAGRRPVEPHDSELAARARQGLATIPAEQREAVSLAFFRGLTAEQIATMQDVPLGTAKTRLRLAMTKLRSSLQPLYTDSDRR